MARIHFYAKKIIWISLLMGGSFYVYQQLGKQETSQNDDALHQDILPLTGKTEEPQVEDEAWLDTVNHGIQNKADAHQKKLLARHTRGKDRTGQHSPITNAEIRENDLYKVKIGGKYSRRLGDEGKRYPWIRREGRDEKKNQPRRGMDRRSQPAKESTINKGNHHRSGKRKELTKKVKTRKAARLLRQKTGSIENNEKSQHFCNDSFEYGQMCPTLYKELGGYCKMDKTVPGGFDCPDIRKKGYNELRSTQLVLTRLLKIFDLIARKHGIKYWITSGTLLGAARHRGFIPWDEDADVAMTLSEYIKFFKRCKNEFPEVIFFQSSATDPYLRPTNDTGYRLVKHPVVGIYRRLWNPRLRDTQSCTKFCLEYGCEWADGLLIDIFIAEDSMDSHRISGVFPLKEMLFEGFRFPVPNNWREILEDMYGDYNKLGGDNNKIPEDNSDPFHSCEELKQARINKLTADFYVSVLLLTINFAITLSK